jgi:uncharacterized protein (TIGR02186 family)
MIRNRLRQTTIAALLLAAASFLACPGMAAEQLSITLAPQKILIGTQYNGINLQVNGNAPAGSDVILRFTGDPATVHLRKKGKVFNLLWMNVGTVTLDNVPKVCIIDSSKSFDELPKAASRYSLEGLAGAIHVEEGIDSTEVDIRQEFLQLKMLEGLYSQSEQGISFGPEKDGIVPFTANLTIPSALSPGDYHVEAVAVREGEVIGDVTTTISAQMVGFPAWLNQMAFHRSLLYGILATVIALVSGLLIGLVFQSKGAH